MLGKDMAFLVAGVRMQKRTTDLLEDIFFNDCADLRRKLLVCFLGGTLKTKIVPPYPLG